MNKSLLEIYALAVCFVTVVCFVIAMGMALYDIVEIAFPAFTLNAHEFARHQSDEAFLNQWPKDKPLPKDQTVAEVRERSYQVELLKERRGGLQGLTQAGIVVLLDVLLFLGHWHIARKSRMMA